MKNHTVSEVLSLKNPSFCAYMICSTILVIKMVALSFLTGYKRSVYKVVASPEDVKTNKTNEGNVETHEAVERVRRAHLNDLENIPIFWITALVYLFTHPPLGLSCFLFFTFTTARITHTIIYAVFVVRQPARAILFITGVAIVVYMALHAMIVGFCHI